MTNGRVTLNDQNENQANDANDTQQNITEQNDIL